ncbi:MAG: P-loop NTPase [Elusimicrobiales bacterium]|nr:P-loop NTPase [Elusimicrobiales bacterium]
MTDPRVFSIGMRLSKVRRIIAVTGWKGGIGKSSIACALALALAKAGLKTGLLDADFTGASCHVILGARRSFPKEIEGLEPPLVAGVKFMSASFFSGGRAVALRGEEITQSLLEIFCVTQWRELDYLIIDLPPGISDASLDIIRLVPRAEMLVVTTPSVLAEETLRRSLKLFRAMRIPVAGTVMNMADRNGRAVGDKPLDRVPFDSGYEKTLGNPRALAASKLFKAVARLAAKLDAGMVRN